MLRGKVSQGGPSANPPPRLVRSAPNSVRLPRVGGPHATRRRRGRQTAFLPEPSLLRPENRADAGARFRVGHPFQLVYITQSAWLYEAKVPIATIGLMSELTLAYKFKFLWAPFLDR
jgi:hypothetical protein